MQPPAPIRASLIGLVSVAFLIASTQIATPANAADTPVPVPVVVAETGAVESGASSDTDAIAEAADDYQPGNAASAAELAEAASGQDAVAVKRTAGGMVAHTETGTVKVDRDGETTITAQGMPSIGIGVTGDPEAVKIIDGAVVQTEVAPSTDIVTRATDNGAQMIAILSDHNAPNQIEFTLDLPKGTDLVPQSDGSIAVLADIEVETVSQADADHVVAAADAILGPEFNGTLTEAQSAALNAIPAPRIYTAMKTVQVGTIGAPWAVDANGALLDTHYRITADGISQVIETDANTAYPVAADPWWDFLPKALQVIAKALKTVSDLVFAALLGSWVANMTIRTGGKCRQEQSPAITVCWGGKIQWMAGRGGTTWGTTFLSAGSDDPKKNRSNSAYADLLKHEYVHTTQWRTYGPSFATTYLMAEGVSIALGRPGGCGNIFEILAGLKEGGYGYCF